MWEWKWKVGKVDSRLLHISLIEALWSFWEAKFWLEVSNNRGKLRHHSFIMCFISDRLNQEWFHEKPKYENNISFFFRAVSVQTLGHLKRSFHAGDLLLSTIFSHSSSMSLTVVMSVWLKNFNSRGGYRGALILNEDHFEKIYSMMWGFAQSYRQCNTKQGMTLMCNSLNQE